jgi:hypothetical protein
MAQLASLSVNDTGSLTLPSGTSANRPSLSSTVIVQWSNTGTQSVSTLSGSATTTTTSWTCPAGVTNIELLVVAGGGAGGGYHGGGGGAGGVIYNSAFPVIPTTVYTVTVGAGGTAATQTTNTGNAGSNSSFATLTAIGGGAGISQGQTAASRNNGGSGGGASDNSGAFTVGGAGTPGQGFQGGGFFGDGTTTLVNYPTSGGGGAGGAGGGPDSLYGGFGGPGVCYDISGTPTFYGGGGGGTQLGFSGYFSSPVATYGLGGVGGGGIGGYTAVSGGAATRTSTSGTNGTGGGGGGFLYSNLGGGAGGSGTVIIRYALATATTQATGQTRFNTITNVFENYETANKWKIAPLGLNIVTQGLTCHLDAARYNTSTTWADISGFGNNGTLAGSPTYSSSNGGYFSFNGSSQYVTIGTSVGVSGNVEVSMSAWFYYTGSSTTGSTVMGFGGAGSAGDTFSIFLNNGGAYNIGVAYNGGQNITSNNNVYQPNVWNHVIVTKVVGNVNATTTIYLNGSVVLQATAPSLTPSFVFTNGVIGTWVQSPGTQNFFTGNISNVSVYSRALTQTEVKQNYQAHAGRFELTSPVDPRQLYVTDRLEINLDFNNPACIPNLNPQAPINSSKLVDLANGSLGTLTNGALPVTTPNYKFVRLDGTNDCIAMSNPNVYLGMQHSYDMWVYITGIKDATYQRSYIFDLRGDGVDTGCSSYFLWDYVSAGTVNFITGNSGVEVQASGIALSINTWHHMATTRDGNQWRIYLDGILLVQGTSNLTGLTLNNGYRIGMYSAYGFSTAQYALPGYVGAARIYSKTLTSGEIQTNYQAMKNRYGL